jgi:3-phenylpropionate/cinnamic acid dioxygenase small subunit
MTDETAVVVAKAELVEFLTRHAYALDAEDYDALSVMYAPSAQGSFQGHGPVDGYQAMEDIYRNSGRNLDAQQHILSNFLVELDGDSAETSAYFHAMHFRAGHPAGETFIVGGTYRDRLERVGGQWRIVYHEITYGWTSGNTSIMAD